MILPNPLKAPHPLWLSAALVVMGVGLWLVFWPPADASVWVGLGGPLLGCGSALGAIQLSFWRATGLERATAPAEVNAWIMLLFLGAIIAGLLGNADALATGLHGREATHLGIKLAVLAVFYVVLASILRVRRGKAVLEDERDVEIAHRAAAWGRGALIFCVFGLMVMLGLSPAAKLQWATPAMIAAQLLFALMWGWLCEYVAMALMYWRDRR